MSAEGVVGPFAASTIYLHGIFFAIGSGEHKETGAWADRMRILQIKHQASILRFVEAYVHVLSLCSKSLTCRTYIVETATQLLCV